MIKKKKKAKSKSKKIVKPKKVKKVKTKAKVKKAKKKVLKIVKKVTKRSSTEVNAKKARLIAKGKERGFITYDEILKEFPTIEDDVISLEAIYEDCVVAGIDILEGGRLPDDLSLGKAKDHFKDEASYDSIQMYLKEIGQHSLISGAQEKE